MRSHLCVTIDTLIQVPLIVYFLNQLCFLSMYVSFLKFLLDSTKKPNNPIYLIIE